MNGHTCKKELQNVPCSCVSTITEEPFTELTAMRHTNTTTQNCHNTAPFECYQKTMEALETTQSHHERNKQ